MSAYGEAFPEFASTVEEDRARPGQRLWARLLDNFLYGVGLVVLLGMLFPSLVDENTNEGLLGVMLLPFSLALDALVIASFGSSIGKSLMGLSVLRDDGENLTLADAIERNFYLWYRGLAIGVPIIALFTFMSAYRGMEEGNTTSWDRDTGSGVYNKSGNAVRTWVVAITFLVLSVSLVALGRSGG